MLRCRTTTATHSSRSGFHQSASILSKRLRCHCIFRLAIDQLRHTIVWLRKYRNRCVPHHTLDQCFHLLRSSRTVDANRIDAKRLQHDHRRLRCRAEQRLSIAVKGHADHDRQITDLFNGDHACTRLRKAHHRLYKEQIDTCLHEDLCLFLIYIHQFLKRQITDRLKLSARHRHITRDKSTMILLCDCRPCQVNQLHVHLVNLILEMIFGKLDPVRRKSRRKQNIRSCLNICALQFDQVLRMLQNPFLRAYTNRHSCLHQVTSGCTI